MLFGGNINPVKNNWKTNINTKLNDISLLNEKYIINGMNTTIIDNSTPVEKLWLIHS